MPITRSSQTDEAGWCYEMNGLLAWALEEIGFEVMPMAGAVMRSERGDAVIGNHLVLLVQLDEPWLADVGFGDGLFEPVPLKAGIIHQRGFEFRMEQLDDGYWRLHNHAYGGAASFDFRCEPAPQALLQSQCHRLQTAKDSGFVQNLVCQRFVQGGYEVQLGRVAKRIRPEGVESWFLQQRE